MQELSWWSLFILVMNSRNDLRKEINKAIESILPWLNIELWNKMKEEEGNTRKNVNFGKQVESMMNGTWDTDPNADIQLDELISSDSVPVEGNIVDLLKNQPQTGYRGSIKQALGDLSTAPPPSGAVRNLVDLAGKDPPDSQQLGNVPPEYSNLYTKRFSRTPSKGNK